MMKILKRSFAVLLCAVIAMLAASCSGSGSQESTSSTKGLISQSTPDHKEEFKGVYFDTDVWEAVPFISQELRNLGFAGGEGCQAMPTIVYDPVDGKTAYFGTDVGAIYKSEDGGKTWLPCTFGFEACGANCIAVDPNNIDRVVAIGSNSGYHVANGIHMSTNGGDSWQYVFKAGEDFQGRIGIHNDYNRQIAFDKNSYDKEIGGSAVIYWSRENYTTHEKSGSYNHPAVYKTEDGGKTWKELEGSSKVAGGEIVVDVKTGNVITANNNGVHISTDGGKTWTQTVTGNMECVYTFPNKEGKVWVADLDKIYVSSDGGKTFSELCTIYKNTPERIVSLSVSPADDSRIAVTWVGSNKNFNYKTLYTHDSGKTWKEGSRSKSVGDVMPMNSWYSVQTWHPTDANVIMANGPYISTDGGANFNYSRTGFTGICVGGKINVNTNNNALVSIGSQDFNGGFSTDSGYTWTYVNWSGKGWGGFTYGSYCLDADSVVTSVADGWTSTRYLAYTHNGGKTVTQTELEVKGDKTGYSALGNDDIAFFGEYRTTDRGQTWSAMSGCTAVYTHDPETGRLFGSDGFNAVYSDDNGATWQRAGLGERAITDMAYNYKTKTLYVTTGAGISSLVVDTDKRMAKIAPEYDLSHAEGVVADPENPNILYLCRAWQGDKYNFGSVFRSLDGGETWTCLNREYGDGREGPDGGRQAGSIEFNSITREIIVDSGCRGMWKLKACDASEGK